ncbi:MAG TPA: DUF481 domain-containing protein [Polyangiaceae bacterium]|nr:DUF481 domain-containing protein [Polyangiaceae bacterium]
MDSWTKRVASSAFVLACGLFGSRATLAQVNIESVRSQLDTSSFGARIRFSLSAYAGNTEGLVFGTSGIVGGRIGPNLGFATASADYARLGGTTSVKKSFVHLRHNYEFNDFFWWEEFAQSETDRFRRIEERALFGTGPRFALFKSRKWMDLYAGTSYMLEYTNIEPGNQILEPALVHRLNTYVALTARPDPRITITTIIYYQPRFDEFTDAHVLNVSSVEFKVTPLLTSRMDATTRYESVVPTGVKRADLEFKSSLELKF